MHGFAQRRFGIADLIVLGGIGLFSVAFVAMISSRGREGSGRVRCASNLRQIGLAIQMYANDNKGNFPRSIFDEADNPVPTAYTGVNARDAFKPDGPQPNDVSAALFMALKTQDLTPHVFVCDYDSRAQPFAGDIKASSNFPGRQNLSYSFQNPYPSKAARDAGFKLDFTLSSDFAIAADMNPGGPLMTTTAYNAPTAAIRQLNSNNHGGDGQNVLYADGHVEFQSTPFCATVRPDGPRSFRDNIYTAGGPNPRDRVGPAPVVQSAPLDELDSVLLPVAPEGPSPMRGGPRSAGGAGGPVMLLIVAIVVVGAVVLLIVVLVRNAGRGKPPALS